MKILVTGSRDWPDQAIVGDALRSAYTEYGQFTLVHGACPTGADKMAHDAYVNRGFEHLIERHPANWAKHGRAAGPLRNLEMVESLDKDDVVIAFNHNNSRGTRGCMDYALNAGHLIIEYSLINDNLSVRRYQST